MENYRKNLIITADDFGISPLANAKILALAEAGKLDRTAVMTNGSFGPNDIERIKKTGIKLDIHLDTHAEIPADRKLRDGIIMRGIKFLFAYLSDHLHTHSKEQHWEKQLQDFQTILGRYPDGINSHQHIHFFPAYFKIIIGLAQKNNIFFIRFGRKGFILSNNKVHHILYWLRKKDAKVFRASKLDSTDHMISLDWITNLQKFIRHLPAGTTEIVCHPEREEEFELMQKYF